jgi:hypothetical protein
MEVAGKYGTVVYVSNKDHLIFRDIDFQGGIRTGMSLRGVKNVLVENCNIGNRSGTHGFTVYGSDTGRSGNNGIIRNCNIDADNHVHNYWHAETTDDGLVLGDGVSNWTAYNNYVAGWAHTGIMVGTLSTFHTNNNDVYNNYITCPDIEYGRGSAFYGEEDTFKNNKFHHNIIKDTKTRSQIQSHGIEFYNNIIDGIDNQIRINLPQGMMIYRTTTKNTSDIKIYNNIFANLDGPGLEFSYNNRNGYIKNSIISNNIFYDTAINSTYNIYNSGGAVPSQDVQFVIADSSLTMSDNTYQNNLFYKSSGQNLINYGNDPANDYLKTVSEFNAMTGTDGDVISGNMDVNPLFVNPNDPLGPDGIIFTADDGFRLSAGSSAIDAGIDVGIAYLGNAPDIGAYERE